MCEIPLGGLGVISGVGHFPVGRGHFFCDLRRAVKRDFGFVALSQRLKRNTEAVQEPGVVWNNFEALKRRVNRVLVIFAFIIGPSQIIVSSPLLRRPSDEFLEILRGRLIIFRVTVD